MIRSKEDIHLARAQPLQKTLLVAAGPLFCFCNTSALLGKLVLGAALSKCLDQIDLCYAPRSFSRLLLPSFF